MSAANTVSDVLDRVPRGAADECWEWPGALFSNGYGSVSLGGHSRLVHRVVAGALVGPVDGKVVRHTCDNPPCCNPRHLLVGTTGENVADRESRGRTARGERCHRTRLTEEQVREIRALVAGGGSQLSVATRFGVSRSAVSCIVYGHSWGWLV